MNFNFGTFYKTKRFILEKLRIDKYLWAIRLFKTRTKATNACDHKKVKLNGIPVKPAHPVSVGEQYEIKTAARKWVIQVKGLLHNRVKYKEAINYYADITPEKDVQQAKKQPAAFYTGKRMSKIGRPTKKQRRDLEKFKSDLGKGYS